VHLIIANLGTEPVSSSATGRLTLSLLASIAEFEKSRLAERREEGRTSKRQAGGFVGGSVPFGYLVQGEGKSSRLVPDPAKADVVAFILQMRAASKSSREIAKLVREQFSIPISHETVLTVEKRAYGDARVTG
jgi:DNA invertase Pin-like site-specific DNA recombinase